MKVYIINVVLLANQCISKISQEGYRTLEDAQNWCKNERNATTVNDGWTFESEDYRYVICEVTVR